MTDNSREILTKLLDFMNNNSTTNENLCKIWSIYNKNIIILRQEYSTATQIHWSFRKDHPPELIEYYKIYELILKNFEKNGLIDYYKIVESLYKVEKKEYNLDEVLT